MSPSLLTLGIWYWTTVPLKPEVIAKEKTQASAVGKAQRLRPTDPILELQCYTVVYFSPLESKVHFDIVRKYL
jgi:hypothetical protein